MSPDADRLVSLDVCRGLAVAGMILVNNPGNWSTTFEWITHAQWNGCTPADLVFPTFIFIMGASMTFAFGGAERDRARAPAILQRTAWLMILGLLLNVVAAMPHVVAMRLPGVLQRIGIVYLLAAPLVIRARPRWRVAAIAVLVLGHWTLLTAHIAGAAGLDQAHNLSGTIDRAVFGGHVLNPTGDPEGLLGTMPAIASALLGSIAGEWLRRSRSPHRASWLAAGGSMLIAAGLLWSLVLPLNKPLWTGSFVLLSGGFAAVLLAVCHELIDNRGIDGWSRPFLWLGFNALAVYFLAELVGHLLDAPWLADTGQTMTLRAWAFWSVLRPLGGEITDEWLSLAFAIAAVAAWTAVAGALYRRRIRFRV